MIDEDSYANIIGLSLENRERMDLYYPRIVERIVPLSITGVSPRNFFAWKENGLIELNEATESDKRKNIKLNLIEYIWVKAIQLMRDFGLSYSIIKLVKASLFRPVYKVYEENFGLIETFYKENYSLKESELGEIMEVFTQQIDSGIAIEFSMEELQIETTYFYTLISSCILLNARSSLQIYKIQDEYILGIDVLTPLLFAEKTTAMAKDYPHLSIPVQPLIETFFNEPKSETIGETFGFINPKEKKVLDAIRKKDFLELHIKLDGNKELIVDTIKDGNVTDEQATQIRKILGLNSYEEVTLKYRNDKNLYFKNKKRL